MELELATIFIEYYQTLYNSDIASGMATKL